MAAAAAVAVSAAAPPLLETLRWTAPGAEVAALTTQPAACLSGDARLTLPIDVQAGHALFNSPALLGGQAAKAGLSCASCHVNGRDNPHFLMAGVSDAPGTADVTNSFFSAARSNGRFDPVAIPDLASPGNVSRDPMAGTMQPFIRTLIVEEFSGQEPSPAMLAALAAYVRAIARCPGGEAATPRTLDDQLQLIRAGLAGATAMARRGETQAARSLIAAARHQLGLISERFVGESLARERKQLRDASRKLQALAGQVSTPDAFAAAVQNWSVAYDTKLAAQLRRKAPQSLYYPATLGFVALQRVNR